MIVTLNTLVLYMKFYIGLIGFCSSVFMACTTSAEEISLCYEEWRPYAYKTKKGEYTGIVIDRLKASALKYNTKLKFHELPHSRCVISVKNLHIDFALFIDDTEKMHTLENSVASWDLAIITRPGQMPSEQEMLSADHIKQVIIARDYEYPQYVTDYLASIDKNILEASYYVGNDKDVIRIFSLLLQKKGDAMVVDKLWSQEVKALFNLPVEISDWVIHSEPQYIGYYKVPTEKRKSMQAIVSHTKN